jgi:hypothetical protein
MQELFHTPTFTKDHYFLAPIGMKTKNVPRISGHFFVVKYSGKDVYC